MKYAAPNAFLAHVLDQGRSVIVGRAEPGRQAGHLDVLHADNVIPVLRDIPRRREGEEKSLTAVDRSGVCHEECMVGIQYQPTNVGIV